MTPQNQPWLVPNGLKYGGSIAAASVTGSTKDATALPQVAPHVVHPAAGFLSPEAPGFWFAVVAAVTVGCMAYSTSHKG